MRLRYISYLDGERQLNSILQKIISKLSKKIPAMISKDKPNRNPEMDHKPRYLQKTSIFILTLAMAGWWIYGHVIEPSPFYAQPDPEMAYFIDSLNIFKGNLYGFYHHPGTPVEIIGTTLLSLSYPFIRGSIDSFLIYHIQNPQIFLGMARALLILGSITTMILLSKNTVPIRHWTDEFTAAAIAGLYFVIHPQAFTQILSWSHNSFSFPAGTLISLWLFNMLRSNQRLSSKQLILIGLSTGILTAVQLYFVTWVLGTIVTVVIYYYIQGQGWRQTLGAVIKVGISSLIGFIAVTLPIYQLYPAFLDWVIGILTHQGHYGDGILGFASQDLLISNFVQLWRKMPFLFISAIGTLTLLCITCIIRRKTIQQKAEVWAIGWGLTVQMFITIVLILKHPNELYLQTVAAILPLLLAVNIIIWQPAQPEPGSSQRLLKFGLSTIILFGFFFNLYRAVTLRYQTNQQVHAATREMDEFLEEYARVNDLDQQSLSLLYTYGVPSECFALWYGNSYANYGLSSEIATICPEKYQLDLWLNRVHLPDGTLLPLEEYDWDIIITIETAILEFPDIKKYGDLSYAEVWLPSFGKVAYIVSTGN